MQINLNYIIKNIYFFLLFYLSFYSIFNNFTKNNIIVLSFPYFLILTLFCYYIYYYKNFVRGYSYLFSFIYILISSFLLIYFDSTIIILLLFLPLTYFLILHLKKNINFKVIFIDYIFLFILLISIISFFSELNPNYILADLINSLFNFRFYIFNIIFYLLARLIFNKIADIKIITYLFSIISILIITYTGLEIILLQYSNDILNLEWLYIAQVEKLYFPYSFIVHDPFLDAKYSPNGYLYMRHFSGFANFIIFIFINTLLLYCIISYKNKYLFFFLLILFISFHPIVFLWSSRTILFSYFGTFLISLIMFSFLNLEIKSKLYIILLFFLTYAIIIPIMVINFNFFGLKKNYVDDFKYLFAGPVLRMADAEELICPFKKNSAQNQCEELFVNDNFIYLKISNNLFETNDNKIQFLYNGIENLEISLYLTDNKKNLKQNSHNFDYFFEINNQEYNINIPNKKGQITCNLLYTNTKECNLISKENEYFNLHLENIYNKNSKENLYLRINISTLFTSKFSIVDYNKKEKFSILPKINQELYNCSINRYIYSQENINLECDEKFQKNTIKYKDQNIKNIIEINNLSNITLYNDNYYFIYSSSIFNRLKKLLLNDFILNLNPNLQQFFEINLDDKIDNTSNDDLNKKIPEGLTKVDLREYKSSDTFINIKINKLNLNNKYKIINDENNLKLNIVNENDIKKHDLDSLTNLELFYLFLTDKSVIYGTNSYLNNFASSIISKLNLSYYNNYIFAKEIMKTESDMPIMNFFHEYGLILVTLCSIFFLGSVYICLNLFFSSNELYIRLIAFFSFSAIFIILIGVLHLNLLFKIEIGYLIFTIIGINSNLYANRFITK